MALIYEPNLPLAVPKALLFITITILCVVTAKSKGGVLLGVGAIIVFRLFIGFGLFGVKFK